MDLTRPRFAFRDDLFAARPHASATVKFAGLWCAGSWEAALSLPRVAIVGARAPSAGGIARAKELAERLARARFCVISGLALGIDGAAHLGALTGGAPTIGVLGGGHRQFFPKRNRELADRIIAAGGAVLSPYAPDEPARPAQFLQRNGIVAALADAVVVVEAAERSGALNTAGWAANLGIDVFAYPGDVDRSLAAGCNALIRDGATLVRDAADVLEALGYAERGAEATPSAAATDARDPLQCAIVAALRAAPRAVDDLVALTGANPGAVLAAVVQLEIAGAVEARDVGCYALPTRTARQ